jgi:hypothetical protein
MGTCNLHFVRDDRKLIELILYILHKSEKDKFFGPTKLNNLLFYCDFNAYVYYEKPITGHEYIKRNQRPVPRHLIEVQENMVNAGDIVIQQNKIIPLRSPDSSVFSPNELGLVDDTILKFRNKPAKEILEQSNFFIGLEIANEEQTIIYQSALLSNRELTDEEIEYGKSLEPLAKEILKRKGK